MLSPKKTAGMVALTILVASTVITSTAFANQGVPQSISELDASFAGFEVFLNDLSQEINQNIADIANLQGNRTITNQHLVDHHSLVDVNTADISAVDSRLTAVEATPSSLLGFGSFTKNGLGINNDDVFLGFNNICFSSDTRCFFLSQRIIPMAGTISNIIVRIDGSTTNDYKFTVYKNGIQTSLTCTITASGSTECNDMINSFTVQAGDTINLANSFISVAGGSDDRLVQACISLNP